LRRWPWARESFLCRVDDELSVVPLKFFFVEDLFVLIDDATAVAADYRGLEGRVSKHAGTLPGGLGVLTIIPKEAKAPSPEVRSAIHDLLTRVGPSLVCLCWLVEGGGFHSAMVQAVLTGMRMLGRFPYPTHVSTELEESIGWMLPMLRHGVTAPGSVQTTCRLIRERGGGRSVREL
jgi:hypothetical protein